MPSISYRAWLFVFSGAAVFFVIVAAAIIFSRGNGADIEPAFAIADEKIEDEKIISTYEENEFENEIENKKNENEFENENENEKNKTEFENETAENKPPAHARLAFVGDIMCHADQLTAAKNSDGYDFHYAFEKIAPYIRAADFALGNLETTLVREKFAGWPLFRSPKAFAEAIRDAGFDMVTTGNNHSFDAGVEGVRSTIEILGEVGLAFTGTYLTPESRDEISVVEVNGFSFAILNFTMHTNAIDFGENNFMVKIIYHDLVAQATIDYEMIRENMARARALQTDFIIVSPHLGIEYYGTMNKQGAGHRHDNFDRSDSRWVNWIRTLELFLDEGADFVLNHHPHTLLPAEFVYVPRENAEPRRAFVAYSLANFVSGQRTQPRETGAIIYVDVARDEHGEAFISAASYVPVWVKNSCFTILPVTEEFLDANPERMRKIHNDVTHMFSGEPLENFAHEYEITRSRLREEFPGLPRWGSLPWR
ncbi:MAG: CapA family protein [Defluviitaleaceae bacterium]|nr:CapA family protein [Defluviitaleaceae bacterium]